MRAACGFRAFLCHAAALSHHLDAAAAQDGGGGGGVGAVLRSCRGSHKPQTWQSSGEYAFATYISFYLSALPMCFSSLAAAGASLPPAVAAAPNASGCRARPLPALHVPLHVRGSAAAFSELLHSQSPSPLTPQPPPYARPRDAALAAAAVGTCLEEPLSFAASVIGALKHAFFWSRFR